MPGKDCLLQCHAPWRSSRLFTIGMCFLVLFCMQSMRLNMSVAIVCMINHTATMDSGDAFNHSSQRLNDPGPRTVVVAKNASMNDRDSNASVSLSPLHSDNSKGDADGCLGRHQDQSESGREDGPFPWTKAQQGLVLNSYFWGNAAATIPCAWLVNRFQSVRILSLVTILSSVFCLLIPSLAFHGLAGVIVLRTLTGTLAAAFHPAVQNLMAKWISPAHLGCLASLAFSGATCGTIGTFILSGYLCKYGFGDGWQSVFYVTGSFCLASALLWSVTMHEYPASLAANGKDRDVSVIERREKVTKRKPVPWKRLLTSKPVYAIFVCTAAIDFYGTITTLYLPTYLADVLKFKITSNGLLSSLPYASKSVVQLIGGTFSDFLLKKTSLSVGTVRKVVVGPGKIICCATIATLGFLTCHQASLAVALVVTSVAASGLIELGPGINTIDIAGTYAGSILCLALFISMSFGVASSSLTSAITSQNPSQESWQIVFLMTSSFVFATFIVYTCLASGERQAWAMSDDNNDDNENENDNDRGHDSGTATEPPDLQCDEAKEALTVPANEEAEEKV